MPLAAPDFDPSRFIQERAAEQAQAPDAGLHESEVVVKGIPYRVFRTPVGVIFLPRIDHLSKEDVERGLCANQLVVDPQSKDMLLEDVTVARAEVPLTADVVAYTELVTQTIRRKCGGQNPTWVTPLTLKPEVGVSWKGGTDREPTTYKIYNQGFPGLGFKSEW